MLRQLIKSGFTKHNQMVNIKSLSQENIYYTALECTYFGFKKLHFIKFTVKH
jgi:hypothetical protein